MILGVTIGGKRIALESKRFDFRAIEREAESKKIKIRLTRNQAGLPLSEVAGEGGTFRIYLIYNVFFCHGPVVKQSPLQLRRQWQKHNAKSPVR
jgi:hypothetical protein